MRKVFISSGLSLLIGASPALATQGSVNLATPTGSVQTTSDSTATNLINIGAICGATSTATLYIACANQAIVNTSGQLGVIDSPLISALGTPMQTTGGTVGLVAGSALVGKFGIDQTTPGTTNGVQVNAAIPAGTNLMGKVGIDQTTVGTTNGVSLAQVGATTVATGTGAVGAGSQRVAVGTDTATIAGSAPGTAGTASTNVLSVQGIASMTPLLANPGTAANWGVLAQNATTSGQLAQLMMGAVTTAAPTYSTTQSSPLSLDTAGNLRVNVVTGGGSGGTSAADAAAWTAGTTSQTPIGCEFTSGGATAIVTAHMGTVGCTAARAALTDKSSVGGTALVAATSAYGTAPTGTAVEGVNAFITNTNANGSAVSASSSPVVIASDQAAVAIKAASASIASGAFATGSIASGAIAAGASAGDPCMYGTKTNLPISTNATALTQIIALSGSTKIYICSISLIAPGATAFNLVGGTGTNCASTAAAILGSTTAANGLSFAANGGITLGNGSGVIALGAAGSELCTLQSNAVQVAGNLTYVQQ